MKDLVKDKEDMNKLMLTYIDRVRADPNTYIVEKTVTDRLCNRGRKQEYPTLYEDGHVPSFAMSMLYGLDWDFLMLNVLMITAMERAGHHKNNAIENGLAVGVLVAYSIDSVLIWARDYYG